LHAVLSYKFIKSEADCDAFFWRLVWMRPKSSDYLCDNLVQSMVATQLGVQKISGITLYAVQERKHYEPLQDIEVKCSNFPNKVHLSTC
jgi:hypothetical protein